MNFNACPKQWRVKFSSCCWSLRVFLSVFVCFVICVYFFSPLNVFIPMNRSKLISFQRMNMLLRTNVRFDLKFFLLFFLFSLVSTTNKALQIWCDDRIIWDKAKINRISLRSFDFNVWLNHRKWMMNKKKHTYSMVSNEVEKEEEKYNAKSY